MGNATIVIERPRGGTSGRFAASTVVLDGEPAGSLEYGSYLRLDVEPGQHRVWLNSTHNPLHRSNPVEVDLQDGARCVLSASTSDRLFGPTSSGSEWMRPGPGQR